MNFIMLAGKKGSGKTTIADLMESQGFEVISIATPIKNAARALFLDTPYTSLGKGDIVPELDAMSYREILQNMGLGLRDFKEDFWVKHLLMRARYSHGTRFVVDDFRFPNEPQVLRDLGHHVGTVRIVVNGDEGHDDGHVTENSLEDFDFDIILDNDCKMAVGENGPYIEYEYAPVQHAQFILNAYNEGRLI